jgi:Ribosomal protein L15
MPLQRRVPKFGFKNINRVEYKAINLDIIEYLATTKGITEITIETFLSNGLLSNNQLVKVLGRGTLNSKVTISAHGFSAAAITAIEAHGGICSKI